jgi:hypothetical protein
MKGSYHLCIGIQIFIAYICVMEAFIASNVRYMSIYSIHPHIDQHLYSNRDLRCFARRKTTIRRKPQSTSDSFTRDGDASEAESSASTGINPINNLEALSANIQDDINEFTKPRFMQEQENLYVREQEWKKSQEASSSRDIFKPVKDVISFILIADFFVVLGFLAWFLVAVALKGSAPVVLEK